MVRLMRPELFAQKNAIIPCDNWYSKKDLVCVVNQDENLEVICNVKYSVPDREKYRSTIP